MAGVLYSSGDREGVEASGVYEGILTEDMITTVKRVKKPFIDVYIKELFFDNANYPLTFVPAFNMVLPLKKDQKVWVYFNQENHRYPVLWKMEDEANGCLDGLDVLRSGSLGLFSSSDGDLELKSAQDMDFEAKGKYIIRNKSTDIFDVFEDLYDILKNFNVVGSSTSQNTGPGSKLQLLQWQMKYQQLIRGPK